MTEYECRVAIRVCENRIRECSSRIKELREEISNLEDVKKAMGQVSKNVSTSNDSCKTLGTTIESILRSVKKVGGAPRAKLVASINEFANGKKYKNAVSGINSSINAITKQIKRAYSNIDELKRETYKNEQLIEEYKRMMQ